jgi:hypothetical protein
MNETLNPNQSENNPSVPPEAEIDLDTFEHNVRMLTDGMKDATEFAQFRQKTVEDKNCMAVPLYLYVNSETGGIASIVTKEQELNNSLRSNRLFSGGDMSLEVPNPEDYSGVVKIPTYFVAAPTDLHSEQPAGQVLYDRPESWVRNDQIILSSNMMEKEGLETMIPDPTKREVFLKSIEMRNNTLQPVMGPIFPEQ